MAIPSEIPATPPAANFNSNFIWVGLTVDVEWVKGKKNHTRAAKKVTSSNFQYI
jgi:hypothetical protein